MRLNSVFMGLSHTMHFEGFSTVTARVALFV